MENRKTVKDWRKAWRDSIAKTQKIENEIKVRLQDLCKAHPDVVIGTKANADRTPFTAKEIKNIDGMQTSARLAFIEVIEKALADAHPHQQLNLYKEDVQQHPDDIETTNGYVAGSPNWD